MKKRIIEIFETVVLILAVIALIFACIYLFKQTIYSKYKEQKRIETIKEQIIQEDEEQETREVEGEETVSLENTNEVLQQYEQIHENNNDFYGWITIEGTKIDNPIMYCQADASNYWSGNAYDEDYYLRRNFDGEISSAGELFVDVRTVFGETENTIIYGHSMKNGTMFGSLKKYKNQNFYEDHKYIRFDTIYEQAEYEIVAVSKTITSNEGYQYYDHVELDSKEEFDTYIQNAKNNSYFETGVTAEYGDTLITLSTCDYWTDNARLYIVAKKVQKEP